MDGRGRLAAARRHDARFLLPDPDSELIGPPPEVPGTLAADGTLIIETRGPLRALGLGRRLRALGFLEIRSYWHWPSFERCTRIVPLEDATAVRYALSRSGSGSLDRMLAGLASLLSGIGALPWIAAHKTFVVRRRAGDRSFAHAFLRERWSSLFPEDSSGSPPESFLVLTPRFRNSRRLVFLFLREGATDPLLVVKVPRPGGACAQTEREGRLLARIHSIREGGFDSIPRRLACEPYRGRTILVETAMPGRAMDRGVVRRDPRRCCEQTLAWLLDVQLGSRRPSDRDAIPRLLERDLVELEGPLAEDRGRLDISRDLVRPLDQMDLPAVLEHGDLSHPNLLVGTDTSVAVVDWETAEPDGIPMTDLVFFLAYVARALEREGSPQALQRALNEAFAARSGWATAYLRRYAEALELPRESVAPLFVACWIRQLAALLRRGHEDGAALRRDWRYAFWRHVVDQATRGGWDHLA